MPPGTKLAEYVLGGERSGFLHHMPPLSKALPFSALKFAGVIASMSGSLKYFAQLILYMYKGLSLFFALLVAGKSYELA